MSIDHRHPPFKAGDKVFGVSIQRLIGSGGQAFVYEGVREGLLKNSVALKAIPNAMDSARNVRQRAEQEAILLDLLNHPNIVRVHAANVTDDGVVCIVMEMLKGRSLRALLRELDRVRVDEALLIGAQIAEGVQVAHELDAIHRDLKPENVYIEPGNLVKVLDFGIAKIVGLGAVTTQENLIQGTVQYMSPEHLQGRPVTICSDVFALGCILFELLSGSTPAVFGVQSPTMDVVGWNQIARMPPQLDSVTDDVPTYVARAIQLMLAKEPADRPATMVQVASELRALYARYTKSHVCAPRDLWQIGAGIAPPLVQKPVQPTATTVPVAAASQGAQGVMVEPTPSVLVANVQHVANATKPLPLMVRNPALEPKPRDLQKVATGPTVHVARSLPASPEPQASPERARAIVAGAERVVAQQRLQQTSLGTGTPITVTARGKPPPLGIHWHRLVAAIGAGSLVGAIALLGLVWSSKHNAKANSPVDTKATVIAQPKVTAPSTFATETPAPSITGGSAVNAPPAPSIRGGNVVNAPPATAPARANSATTPPQPQLVARREPQPAATTAPAEARSAASTKPAPRKAKAPAGKLPFGADELTF